MDARRAEHVLQQTAGPSNASAGPSKKPTGRRAVRFTRSTTGCLSCRKSKVKCDETVPVCLRCVASQRECQYPKDIPDAGMKRRRRNQDSTTPDHSFDLSGFGDDGLDFHGDLGDTDEIALSGLLSLDPTLMSEAAVAKRKVSSGCAWLTTVSHCISHAFFPQPDLARRAHCIAESLASSGHWPVVPATATEKPQETGTSDDTGSTNHSGLDNRDAAEVGASYYFAESSAHANDDLLYEFGPSHRFPATHDLVPPLPSSLESLTDAFPSPTALLLFHNFCTNTSRILVTMGDNGPNPILGLCTQQRLLDITSPAAAAMRMSMLSASVVHYVYETEQLGEHTPAGVKWGEYKINLKEMSDKFKRAAVSNIVLAAGGDAARDSVDNLLAACTLLCIRDVSGV